MNTRDAVLALSPYPARAYESLDLNRLTVFVLQTLSEMDIPPTIENVAVASFRLFPGKFQMVGYPEFPDMARSNRALLQLHPKYRGWASGSAKRGFVLTPAGEQQAEQAARFLGSFAKGRGPEANTMEVRQPGKAALDQGALLARLRGSSCFQKHQKGETPRGLDFLDMLNAYSHTPPEQLRSSMKLLKTIAQESGDEQVIAFLKWCRTEFAAYLKSPLRGGAHGNDRSCSG